MSNWALRRFWKTADISQSDQGFTVLLDGRRVMTPARAPLVVPTRALAQAIADEWQAQEETVTPATMPFTRMSNSALDKLGFQREAVADMLAAYGDSDLTCYRADSPETLVKRQKAGWDPLLDWLDQEFKARLLPRSGVIHAPQDEATLKRLSTLVHEFTPFELAAFHDLVSISGSLVIALAYTHGGQPAEALWDLSRIDEHWQEEQWGRDEEAHAQAEYKRSEFLHAARFFDMTRG